MSTTPITVNIPYAEGLAKLVKSAIVQNRDGIRDEIAGVLGVGAAADPFVKPNLDGTWPTQTRSATKPGTLMWLRQIDEDTFAPMPTEADGFRPGILGDLVFPLPEAAEPGTTMLFSDSFNVATSADFNTRTGDAYAGGAAPTWTVDKSQAGTDGRCRVLSGEGLNIYNNVWLRATPALPTSGAWRAAFTITSLDASHTFQIPLRSAAYNDDTARTRLRFSNDAGVLAVTVVDTTDGSVTLGQVALTVGQTRVVVEFDGAQVRVTAGGVALTPGAVSTRLPRLGEFVFRVPSWHSMSVRDVTVETL